MPQGTSFEPTLHGPAAKPLRSFASRLCRAPSDLFIRINSFAKPESNSLELT
jgi:hypothetical protein